MVHRSPIRFLLAVLLILPTAVFAQIGSPSGGGDSISWDITASGQEKVELRITGGDVEYTRTFSNANAVRFNLRDLPGSDIEDGVYQWELRLVPKIPSGVAKQLESARNSGDEKAAKSILKKAGITVDVAQSGAFTIANGSIVTMGLSESNAARTPKVSTDATGSGLTSGIGRRLDPVVQDQVIPDDLIVQGSICAGFDCVNNESFGFDTIRLKENNTRIKFEDTSTGSFPTNDWQLTANDSASGGASKFSVEDITGSKVPMTITAGASTNSIFVDSTGRVGFRTATPVLDLHVSTSNTPALRLEQTNSGGFTAQTWDVAGNEANFFVRDVTSGSRLPFRIRPGAPTSSVDISADGDVGIGTASPDYRLEVDLNANGEGIGISGVQSPGIIFETVTADATDRNWGVFSNHTSHGDFQILRTAANTGNPYSGTSMFSISSSGNVGIGVASPTFQIHHSSGARLTGGTWTDASSREYKQNIATLDADEAMAAFKQLEPVTYEYKIAPDEKMVGFIAEDVPELVATTDHKALSAMNMVALLTKVVQEQQKTIEDLSKKVDDLQKQD